MTERELLELKEKIEKAKSKQSEIKGRKKALLDDLKDTHGCKSIKEADKKRQKLKKQYEKMEGEIEKLLTEIENDYVF